MLDHNIHPHFFNRFFCNVYLQTYFLSQGDPGPKGISGVPGQIALKVKRRAFSFDIERVKNGLVVS